MKKIKIGVAGANGAFGTKHLQALSAIDDAEVAAVMATSLNKANLVGDGLRNENMSRNSFAWHDNNKHTTQPLCIA